MPKKKRNRCPTRKEPKKCGSKKVIVSTSRAGLRLTGPVGVDGKSVIMWGDV